MDVIKQAVSLRGLLDYFGVKRKGKMYYCPIHGDKTPSLSISEEKGLWKCFGCGAGGDIYTLVMKIKNLDFGEAKAFLRGYSGVSDDESFEVDRRYISKIDQIYKENKWLINNNISLMRFRYSELMLKGVDNWDDDEADFMIDYDNIQDKNLKLLEKLDAEYNRKRYHRSV